MTEDGSVIFEQKNKFSVGDTLEAMMFDGTTHSLTVSSIRDDAGMQMESAPHPQQMLSVQLHQSLPEGCILRKKG